MRFRRVTQKITKGRVLVVLGLVVAYVCYQYRPLKAPNDHSRRVPIPPATGEETVSAPDVPVEKRVLREPSPHAPKRTITGVVLNPDGSRASGADVHAFLLGLGPVQYEEERQFRTTTDARGTFELPGLPFGTHGLSACGEDSSCLTWTPSRGSEFPKFHTLRMTPVCTVSGQVLGTNGDPVPEARVWLLQTQTSLENEFKGPGRSWLYTLFLPVGEPVSTDTDGRFAIPFAPRTASRLLVSKEGYAEFQSEAFGAPSDETTVALGTRGQLTGTIVDSETGEGIPGTTVVALDENLVGLQTTVSGEAGEFFFPSLRPAIHELRCSDSRYTSGDRGLLVQVNDNERLEGVQLRAWPTVSVSGRVWNAQSGEPFPGVRIDDQPDAPDVTDENGNFHLDHVLPGRRIFTVHGEGASAARSRSPSGEYHTILVKPGEDLANVEISVHPEPVLRGRTVDTQGQPVPHATIGIGEDGSGMTVSDAEGRFAFSSVARCRKYSLWAQRADLVCVRDEPVEIPALGDPPEVSLILSEGGTVSGHAVGSDGSPLANVQLCLRTHDLSRQYTTSGMGGSFLFVGVPAGEHEIEFGFLGSLANSEVVEDAKATFECAARDDVSGVRIVLPEDHFDSSRLKAKGSYSIKGIVVAGDGTPIPGADIEFFATGREPIHERIAGSAQTLHDGTFEIEDLPLYTYHVYLHGYSMTYWGVGSHHKITVPGLWPLRYKARSPWPSGQITGQVLDKATGDPVTQFEIATDGHIDANPPTSFKSSGRTLFSDEEGRFSVANDRFGDDFDTLLHAFAKGYAPGTINLGETRYNANIKGNVFHLVPEGVIEGTVTAKDGYPLPGAAIGYAQGDNDSARAVTCTRSDGMYRIGGMGLAEFTLCASHPIGIAERKHVSTAPGKTTHVDFVIRKGGVIEGRITKSGQPVNGRPVTIILSNPRKERRVQTDADGYYQLKRVPPGSVRVGAPGLIVGRETHTLLGERLTRPKQGPGRSQQVDVAEDSVVRVDFELAAASDSALTGTVTERGRAHSDGHVYLSVETGNRRYSTSCTVDSDGGYRFEGFPAGTGYVSHFKMPAEPLAAPVGIAHRLELKADARISHNLDYGRKVALTGRIEGVREEEQAFVLDFPYCSWFESKIHGYRSDTLDEGEKTSSSGEFRIKVYPGIRILLVATTEDDDDDRFRNTDRSVHQCIEVPEEGTNHFVLSLPSPASSLGEQK